MSSLKELFKKTLFGKDDFKVIKSGPASGMKINYDIENRFQHLLGLYEREIYPYMKDGIKKAKTLVDVGANDGYYIMAFLKTGKTVIACEPGAVSNEIIKNATANGFLLNNKFMLEKRLVGSGSNDEFVSIPQLIKGSEKPFFFLIDIDGGEFALLNSCGNDFDHSQATWIIETHTKELETQCINYLKEKKYSVKIIKKAWWRIIIPERRPLEHNQWLYAYRTA